MSGAAPVGGRRVRGRLRGPVRSAGTLAVVVLLAYLVLVPLGIVIAGSLTTTPVGVFGGWSLDNYRRALGSDTLLASARSTLVFSGAVTVVATAIGVHLAWVTQRTTAPGRRVLAGLALLPVVVPGIVLTNAWVQLLHPRVGLLNLAATSITGADRGPFDAYTMAAMVVAEVVEHVPLVFLLVAAALRAMDPVLEEAAVMAGAGVRRTVLTVTLPAIAPAILAGVLLTLVRSVGSFTVPLLLGVPGGIRVLSTEVYLASRLFPVDGGAAAAAAVLHLLLAVALLVAYRYVTRDTDRFVTVAGRPASGTGPAVTAGRRLHAAASLAVLVVVVVLPVAVMVWSSLVPLQLAPGATAARGLTLEHYRWALGSTVVRRAARNSAVLGLGSGVVVVTLGAVVAWMALRARPGVRRVLDVTATLPLAVPGSVLGVALLWWYLIVPLPVYATLWIIGIAYVTAFLPYAVRTMAVAVAQVHPELEEASTMSGASRARTFLRVVVPLVGPGLTVATIYVFTRSLRSLALPALLAGPGDEVLAVLIQALAEDLRYPQVNALGVLLTAAVLALAGMARVVTRHAARTRAAGDPIGTRSLLRSGRSPAERNDAPVGARAAVGP